MEYNESKTRNTIAVIPADSLEVRKELLYQRKYFEEVK
jgi:hypothetical protein